ncbi:transcription factor EMB1444-like [Vicia villosa]|uniref:transcription factor EMB1444-like n=1 Tax=Vicia villosa TaxID=3911 RepID=UPI00273C6488|nr:transcription factor EMB1444-like [Vicia villosa]
MMGANLHQLLRSLCLDTDWKYAVFWKLQHCARMILTWEDAYYDNLNNCDSSQSMYCQKNMDQICGRNFSNDPLGLSLAKMSYHEYSLGEGIVGQVAVSGKHQWICADNQLTCSSPSFKLAEECQSQFSAGIRTIVVVAVVPLGVVQLGSSNKVSEDMGFVTHIRSLFLSTCDQTLGYLPSQIQSVKHDTRKTMMGETPDGLMPFQCPGKNYSPPTVYQKMTVDARHGGLEITSDQSSILLQSMSNMMTAENRKLEGVKPSNERKCEGNNNSFKDTSLKSDKNISSVLQNSVMDNNSVRANVRADTEMSMFQTESYYEDISYTLKFPAGYELHEALGPGFLKESKYFDWAVQGNQDAEMSDEFSCSQLTSESRPEHLLEAVVTKVCHSNNIVDNELSFSTSVQDAMVSGRNPEVPIHNVRTINSEGYSIDQPSHVKENKHNRSFSSSGICGVISPKSFSSACPSSCSNQFERSSEPSKNSKKRARPGESCRPRPRDRQLIQDRIKELRELVPNGAKCSIDSLLECTIKHMLFLQSITKHADKLNKFSETKTKLHDHVEKDIHGTSGYQQGSSWAMEVGGHLKVHSILVENLSKNGQMLVEMLCEECSHFLEIAEAMRSLGLKILNGATKAHGEKTCISFVVEGQNNRNLHRLDILWPLVQLLQSKSIVNA